MLDTLTVELSLKDWELARRIGRRRYDESQRRKLSGRAGCLPNLKQDIQGAAAEVAFARLIGVEPDLKVNVGLVPDIAGVHVRSTSLTAGRLIVRDADCEDGYYVLMIGRDREWRFAGGIPGKDAKRKGKVYQGNGRAPCKMVSQGDLNTDLSAAA